MYKLTVAILALIPVSVTAMAGNADVAVLKAGDITQWSIVVAADAIPSEKYAAEEFQGTVRESERRQARYCRIAERSDEKRLHRPERGVEEERRSDRHGRPRRGRASDTDRKREPRHRRRPAPGNAVRCVRVLREVLRRAISDLRSHLHSRAGLGDEPAVRNLFVCPSVRVSLEFLP